jgi:AGCS family alanine or glycine:cation symporter
MGSTPHAHAQASVQNPHQQGVAAMIGVFVDTFVVLTITAMVVICALYTDGGILANGAAEGITKNNMMQVALGTVFGSTAGNILVAVCLTFFAFTTIISWNFFGKQNVEYLGGKKATVVYSVIAIAFIFLGTVFQSDLVWELTDFFNYLMVLPNVIALFALSAIVVSATKDHKKKSK